MPKGGDHLIFKGGGWVDDLLQAQKFDEGNGFVIHHLSLQSLNSPRYIIGFQLGREKRESRILACAWKCKNGRESNIARAARTCHKFRVDRAESV